MQYMWNMAMALALAGQWWTSTSKCSSGIPLPESLVGLVMFLFWLECAQCWLLIAVKSLRLSPLPSLSSLSSLSLLIPLSPLPLPIYLPPLPFPPFLLSLCSETNLKVRQPLPETAELGDHKDKLSAFNGIVHKANDNNTMRKLAWGRVSFLYNDNNNI